MARRYGQVKSSLWTDPDFLALDTHARFLYVALTSQPDVSACGRVAVGVGRFAKAIGSSRIEAEQALEDLADARFIFIDWETDELVIRSFIKHDAQGNQNRIKAAVKALAELSSEALAKSLRDEYPNDLGAPADAHTEGAYEGAPDAYSGGYPQSPGTRNQEPGTNETRAADAAADPAGSETSEAFEKFWNAWPAKRRREKQKARTAWNAALRRRDCDLQLLRDAFKAYQAHWRAEGEDYAPYPAKWLRNEHWRRESWPTTATQPVLAVDVPPPWDDMTDAQRVVWAGVEGVDPGAVA